MVLLFELAVDKKINSTMPNTDGIINKLVTVFAFIPAT